MQPPIQINQEHLKSISIMGIESRLLDIENVNYDKQFVLLGGQHTSIERMYAIAQFLGDFGSVKLIDLPGFGGVDSFRKIGKKINLDNYATYLHQFIVKNDLKDFDFFATSFSSIVVTRMLQMYPETQKRVRRVILFVGFSSGEDFSIRQPQKTLINILITLTSNPVGANIFKFLFTNKISLWLMLKIFSIFKTKMKSNDKKVVVDNIAMEYQLWTNNDRETHAKSTKIMFGVDLTRQKKKIDLTCHNIVTTNDQYFDVGSVNQGFKQIYSKYKPCYIKLNVHAPSLIADKADVAKIMGDKTISLLKN